VINTAQINEPDYVEFSAQADPTMCPRMGIALSPANETATTIVAALDLAPGKRSGRHTHTIEERSYWSSEGPPR
jgi:hypothetical protein